MTDSVFYLSDDTDNGMPLTIEGTLNLASHKNERGIRKTRNGKSEMVQLGIGGLSKVEIGTKVTSIGNFAFSGYYALQSVTIPDSVTSIGEDAFNGCLKLQSVTLPNNVNFTRIGVSVFERCSKLQSVTIPDSVTSIGTNAFLNCSGLTTVTIPDSVTTIDNGAFKNCHKLESVTLPTNVNFTSIGVEAFKYCIALHSVTIPDSVTSIGFQAFQSCRALLSVTIPNSVTSIGTGAFSGCTGLKSVTLPNNVNFTSIGDSAFQSCSVLPSITIPDSVTSIGNSAFKSCIVFRSVTIPDSVTSIGTNAFLNCSGLTSVTLPNNVNFTSIGNQVFKNCNKLQSVTIPDSVTSIGDSAFDGCRALQSVTIPDSVTSIGDRAFAFCIKLPSVTLPNNVNFTSIGDSAFDSCNALQNVTIPDSVTSIGDRAFAFCGKLLNVTIPDSVTSIRNGAFASCRALKSLTIGHNVTSIGNKAFDRAGITNVKIPYLTVFRLKLKPNAKQDFFGQKNVYVQINKNSFAQPGTISGKYGDDKNLQNDKFDTGSEDVIIRLYVPGKRIYENDRSRILIADFTNIEKKDGTNIRNIKWEKRTKNGNNWEIIDNQNETTYTLTYSDTSTQFRVSCSYDNEKTATSNPTVLLSANEQDTIEENIQKRDNYIDFEELNEFFNKTFSVTVQSIIENKYAIDNVPEKQLTLYNGSTYRFESSDFTNHPFAFSTTENGTHSGGVEYTTGVFNGTTSDNKNYIEIKIDQNTPSTLYYYCKNHANMGGKINIKSEDFNNAEFRKTFTNVFFFTKSMTTISNAGLFENESFLYENMQEVEVGKQVTSITDTPFPENTRYYIHTINKYLKPNTYSWVNDADKQFFFYLNEISNQLAKTKENDGVEIGLNLIPFVYDANNDNARYREKCENVQYVITSNTEHNEPTTIELISNCYRNNNNITKISEVNNDNDRIWRMNYEEVEVEAGEELIRTLTELRTLSDSLIIESGNKFNFPDGIANIDGYEDEYLRLMDIVVKYGNQNKTFKFAIRSDTWGNNQTYTDIKRRTNCFPGNSQLILKDGTKKSFHDIQYGDEIQVCSKDMELSYSKVTFLPHLQNNKLTAFIKFVTESNQSIRVTPKHYLPILNKNDVLENVFAEDITKEDKIYILNNGQGMPEALQSIETIQEKGVYTAYVKEGEYIVLDNVVSSPFGISYNATKNYSTFLSLVDNIGLLPYTSSFIRNGKKIVINILEMFGLMSYFVSKNRC